MARVRAEACLVTNSPTSARDWIDEAYRLIRQTAQGYLRGGADALAQRA